MNQHRPRRGGMTLWGLLVLAILLAGGVVLWKKVRSGELGEAPELVAVTRGDLLVSVLESGQLQAAQSFDVYCLVRGQTTILKIVKEGTQVKTGDLLVDLDTSKLEEEEIQQLIRFEQANASWIQAKEEKEIQESINQSMVSKAQLELDVTRMDFQKFLEGDKKLQATTAEGRIKLAQAEREIAIATRNDTKELYELQFASKTELDSDELKLQRADVDLEKEQLTKQLMLDWDFKREEQVLRATADEAVKELERVKRQCTADMAQKEADLKAKTATLDLEKDKLDRLKEQIANAKVYAETDGMVVYPLNSSGNRGMGSDRDRIEEGATVREHQLLLSIPDTSQMKVRVNVHESALDKVNVGLSAMATVDAYPEDPFYGKVIFIAPLPDSANQWLNPDLKVYGCEVMLTGNTSHLRPGMSASVEIIADELKDVISIPVHAVYRKGRTFYVYVDDGGSPRIREVEVGLHNSKLIAILSGLEVGERVYLAVPFNAPQPEFSEDAGDSRPSPEELRRMTEGISVPTDETPGTEVQADARREGGPPAGAIPGVNAADLEKFRNMSPEERKKALEEALEKNPELKKQLEGGRRRRRDDGESGGGGSR